MARSKEDKIHVSVREEERGYAAAAHLMGAIPFWGLVLLTGIWIYFKERSREVVFHVQQAMMFQTVFLVVGVFWLAAELLQRLIQVLNENVAHLISQVNAFFLIAFFIAYVITCLIGVVQTFLGHSFLYPFVGRRVYEGNLPKSSPEA